MPDILKPLCQYADLINKSICIDYSPHLYGCALTVFCPDREQGDIHIYFSLHKLEEEQDKVLDDIIHVVDSLLNPNKSERIENYIDELHNHDIFYR